MTRTVTVAFRNALRFAAVTITSLAEESGYSPITFDTYVNRRAPTNAAALALAKALDERAARLREHAQKLRDAIPDETDRVDDRV